MADPVRLEVYQRLILGKSLLSAGTAACAERNDRITFARGILLLHDAAEEVLAAVADQLHADLKAQSHLLDYYELIKNADPQKRVPSHKTQMRNLNQIRIDTKHLGVLPDPRTNSYLPKAVRALCEEVCRNYLGVDFPSISLKSLIRNDDVRGRIESAEALIGEHRFEEALTDLGYAMFHLCEGHRVSGLAIGLEALAEQDVSFPDVYSVNQTVDLLGHGVDPYLYFRFKNLTPRIGRRRTTDELVVWWDKRYGHPGNWTGRNARFCLDFCIETALRFQREVDEGYTLVDYMQLYEDVIQPTGERAIFWDQSFSPPRWSFVPRKERRQVFVLPRGGSIVGWAWDGEDSQDEWFVVSRDIPALVLPTPGWGHVLKGEVSITRRQRQA